MRYLFLLLACSLANMGLAQDNLLETEQWRKFFSEKAYLEKAAVLTDDKFWDVDASYTYYNEHTLLLIYSNGNADELIWQYDGLSSLLNKKKPFLDENFDRVEKANIAYIVFDGYLLRNPNIGNAVTGDFTFVMCEGPISIYREYYASPITRDNLQSGLMFTINGELFNFYLGKFEKRAAKLVEDYTELAEKIRSKKAGYFNTQEDILRIANEYNEWVKENNVYRYDDWSGFQFDG